MSRLPLNQTSGMPQMGRAFAGWQKTITMARRTQTIVNGLVTNVDKTFTFKGTIQPLDSRKISLKPEGQRAFSWLQVHCFSGSLNLTDNDRITFNGTLYKIMGVWDYSLNGFIEYHLVQDFQ